MNRADNQSGPTIANQFAGPDSPAGESTPLNKMDGFHHDPVTTWMRNIAKGSLLIVLTGAAAAIAVYLGILLIPIAIGYGLIAAGIFFAAFSLGYLWGNNRANRHDLHLSQRGEFEVGAIRSSKIPQPDGIPPLVKIAETNGRTIIAVSHGGEATAFGGGVVRREIYRAMNSFNSSSSQSSSSSAATSELPNSSSSSVSSTCASKGGLAITANNLNLNLGLNTPKKIASDQVDPSIYQSPSDVTSHSMPGTPDGLEPDLR